MSQRTETTDSPSAATAADRSERQLREINDALLVSSVRQHELTENAQQPEKTARTGEDRARKAEAEAHSLTEQARRTESLIQCQKDSLEMVVQGEPIERVLDFLARSMEKLSEGSFVAAVHLMEPDGYHFGHVAAPSLPARYAQATKGMDARLELGCCSSAVVSRTPTIVRDFAAETRWPAFTAEVVSLGLRACFTTPILSPDNRVLGTFAIYYREPRDPSSHDRQLVDLVTATVALAIDHKRTKEATSRLAAIVTYSDDAIISKDLDGVITSWNQGAEHLFGYSAEEVIGKPVTLLIPEDHLDEEPHILGRIRRGEAIEHYETVRLRKDGSRFDISLTVSPIRDAAGRIIGASKVARDITGRKTADEQLRRSAELLTFLIDRSPSGFYIVDADFRISHINADSQARAFRNVVPAIGRRLDEAMRILWPEPLATELIHIFRHTLETGEPYRSPGLISPRHDLDAVETYEWQLDRITMPDGTHGVVCYYYDTTRLRQAELALRESEQRFRTLADNMAQLAWTCDALGNVTWYNQRWLDYTGLSFEQMKGWDWSKVQHPDHLERVVERVQQSATTGEPWDDTFPLRGKDGLYRWFLSRAVPIRDAAGQIVRWFGTNTDVTEQRELETRTSQQAQSLADLHRRKDEFLAMLSHELRNPLAPILNAVQLLRMEKGGTEIQKEAQGMIERQVSQLARLVDDLLEVSRITTGRIHLQEERIDLRAVVERAIEGCQPQCGQKAQSMAKSLPPEPLWVFGDSTRLEQVVVNLLNNACKYTDRKGHIWVGLEQQAGEAVLRVRDNGIGIPPDLLPRIFDLFTQADKSLDRSQGGLGIGLALVQSIVTMHRGRVEALSTPGQGSEFIVRLPLLLSPGVPAVMPSETVDRPAHSLKVLVVDDNVDAAKGLAMLLRSYDHKAWVAHEGAAAMQLALEYVPDLALLDIGLPVINGFQVAQWIRNEPGLKNVVLVALTGYGQESDRQRSQAAGFDHHLVKPVDFTKLESILSDVAQSAEMGSGVERG